MGARHTVRGATAGGDTLIHRLWFHAAAHPQSIFARVVEPEGETVLTWRDLQHGASAHAGALRRAGVNKGDIVLIFLDHGPTLFHALFGSMVLGAVPSFMPLPSPKQDPALYWPSHRALFARIGPRAILTSAAHRERMAADTGFANGTFLAVEDVPPDGEIVEPAARMDDLALLQHSSGTTGLKKGVALSYRAIEAQLSGYAEAIAVTGEDVIVSWLPVYHDMGLIACTLLPVHQGIPLVSMSPFHWLTRPGVLLDAVQAHGGTLAWLPNFAFQHLARVSPPKRIAARNLGTLRAIINCSEVCRAETFDSFERTFDLIGIRRDQLQVCYAAAETVFAITQTAIGAPVRVLHVDAVRLVAGEVRTVPEDDPAARRLLSCGRTILGLDVVVIGEDGAALPEDHVGEVTVTGRSLFDGYHRQPELTRQKLRGGVYHSSDLGFIHDGELYVLGRMDDVIVVNGRNYMAHDLEAVANRIDGLKPGRNVALGVFSDRLGSHELCVLAERDPDLALDDTVLMAVLRQALLNEADAPAADIRIVEPGWLVKTTSGKISRERNLEKYRAAFG